MWLLLMLACSPSTPTEQPLSVRAVTWNTGTTEGLPHDAAPDDGYDAQDALTSDTWYGDGLAWWPAVDAAQAWLAEYRPDILAVQEIFDPSDCSLIPVEQQAGFYCDGAPDTSVLRTITGPEYQLACHPGKPDKCIAIRSDFGTLQGCNDEDCSGALIGFEVPGCGSGARVARANVELPDGTKVTVAHMHGSSGLSAEDEACRVAQVEQLFVDLGDDEPAANGPHNIVLGDFNTDPGRWADIDTSAARLLDFAGTGMPFRFHTAVGPDATPTYSGLANIDHVLSDSFRGACFTAGVSEEYPPVIDAVYFDHHPTLCELDLE